MTQLVECVLCKHEVIGSNPIISIYISKTVVYLFRLESNQRLGG